MRLMFCGVCFIEEVTLTVRCLGVSQQLVTEWDRIEWLWPMFRAEGGWSYTCLSRKLGRVMRSWINMEVVYLVLFCENMEHTKLIVIQRKSGLWCRNVLRKIEGRFDTFLLSWKPCWNVLELLWIQYDHCLCSLWRSKLQYKPPNCLSRVKL